MFEYDAPLFRPPSEAYSLIFQVTLGCSWNRCAFCEMYKMKRFRARPFEDIQNEIKLAAASCPDIRKIFLADGDALSLSTAELLPILDSIARHFPHLQRVSSYALPRNINDKSDEELRALREAGLKLIYVGIESGDDDILRRINKGETAASTVQALQRAKAAGIKSSVMILNGLGGARFSQQHAVNSAKVLNDSLPEFASVLVLYFPLGAQRFVKRFGDDYVFMDQAALFAEMHAFIDCLRLKSTVFRSDHASNYLVLKGVLNRDREKLLEQISLALRSPAAANLRPEFLRGL